MNRRRQTAASQICVVNDDGSITFRCKRIYVPGIFLEKEIGSGMNGFVVKGYHRLLSKDVAVKFWASLRSGDTRDKVAQGIAEVKKLIEAEHYRSVVLWRTAGVSNEILYAVMDFIHGQPLADWLKVTHPLGLRWQLAVRLIDDVCGMAYSDLYHGDLHAKNIMIDAQTSDPQDSSELKFRIFDFGTSLYTSREFSRARHWRVFNETVNRLVSPFELRAIAPGATSTSETAVSIRDWYRSRLEFIRRALIWHGAEWLIDGDELHESYKQEWKSREAMLSALFPVPSTALDLTRKFIERGILKTSVDELGSALLWGPLEPAIHSTTLGVPGPPWITSITDQAWW